MTQPPSGPPQGPPPWGYPPPQPSPPPNRGLQIFLGVLVGGLATIVLPLLSLGIADQAGFGAIIVAVLVVPVAGFALLFGYSTRPWGIGILIGWAVSLIVLGGACVAILSSLA